jgi:hypothetical protein
LKHPCKECIKADNKARYIPKGTQPQPPPLGHKRCSRCRQIFAATTEFFYSNKNRPDGLNYLCKPCHHEYEQSRFAQPKRALPEVLVCRICEKEKPATSEFFERSNANVYGLNTKCKQCCAADRYKPPIYEPAPPGYKRCRKCLEAKPATSKFFVTGKKAKDRLRNLCKKCRQDSRRKPLPHKPRKRKPVPAGDKQCNICKQFFPRTGEYFHFARSTVDHLQSTCKKCSSKRGKANWRALPYEVRFAKYRKHYLAHKEQHAQKARKYHQSEKGRAKMRTTILNRIARKKAISGNYTAAQIAEQLKRQHYRCYYAACGYAKFNRTKENGQWRYEYHIEHTYPLSRVIGTDIPANDMSYIVLACPSCNQSKNKKFPWEWSEGGRLL